MNLKAVVSKGIMKCKVHSPEILIVAGVVGVVAAGVMACKATLKVDEIIDEHKENMDKIRKVGAEDREDYTQDDMKKDTLIQYVHTGKKLIKLYGPAILIAIVSIIAIFASNNMLKKRCVAIAAAYTATDNAFKAYRQRVVDKYGEEEDRKLYFGTEEIEVTELDEKGKAKKQKKEVCDASSYVKYFTKSNPYWSNDDQFIQTFFDMQRNYLNKVFRTKGFLTLNEVYRTLGFKETNDGMVVGWIYDKNNPVGDNYIQFYDKKVVIPAEDGEGYEDAWALDFNCDGLIYDKI